MSIREQAFASREIDLADEPAAPSDSFEAMRHISTIVLTHIIEFMTQSPGLMKNREHEEEFDALLEILVLLSQSCRKLLEKGDLTERQMASLYDGVREDLAANIRFAAKLFERAGIPIFAASLEKWEQRMYREPHAFSVKDEGIARVQMEVAVTILMHVQDARNIAPRLREDITGHLAKLQSLHEIISQLRTIIDRLEQEIPVDDFDDTAALTEIVRLVTRQYCDESSTDLLENTIDDGFNEGEIEEIKRALHTDEFDTLGVKLRYRFADAVDDFLRRVITECVGELMRLRADISPFAV